MREVDRRSKYNRRVFLQGAATAVPTVAIATSAGLGITDAWADDATTLAPATLKTLAKMFRTTGRVAPNPGLSLKPGARLVREWHGRTHTVTVNEDGFEYAGMSYSTLTKVARKITGAHWSGPRFFGLVRAGARTSGGGDNG